MQLDGFLWLAAGVALGFGVAYLVLGLRASQAGAAQQAGFSRLEAENALLQKQAEDLKATESVLRMEVNEISLSNVRLETLLEESQKLTAQQDAQFEQLSLKTLKALQVQMEEKAQREAQQRQLIMDERIGQLIKPLREVIDHHEQRVKEIEKQHTEDTTALKTHIALIVEETGKLVNVKNKLAEALSNSKGRGDWGEMELIRLLEHSGLLEGVHYEAQMTQDGLRPDITIKLSNQRVLYVDAKTILVNLERLLAAEEAEEESAERKKHAAALEKEILSLNFKAYETRCQESIDFVVLYVPRESMLRAALEEKPALMEQAFQRRILLASPLILMSVLKTVAYGWDQAQLSQKAQEIHTLGRELHKRAALFVERFVKVGDRIEALSKQFSEAELSLKGRQGLVPQLKKFEEYGCKSEKNLPLLSGAEGFPEDDGLSGESGGPVLSTVLSDPSSALEQARSELPTEPANGRKSPRTRG